MPRGPFPEATVMRRPPPSRSRRSAVSARDPARTAIPRPCAYFPHAAAGRRARTLFLFFEGVPTHTFPSPFFHRRALCVFAAASSRPSPKPGACVPPAPSPLSLAGSSGSWRERFSPIATTGVLPAAQRPPRMRGWFPSRAPQPRLPTARRPHLLPSPAAYTPRFCRRPLLLLYPGARRVRPSDKVRGERGGGAGGGKTRRSQNKLHRRSNGVPVSAAPFNGAIRRS